MLTRIMSNLWKILAAVATGGAGLLYLFYRGAKRGEESAQRKAREKGAQAEAHKRARDIEGELREASDAAREESNRVQQQIDERRDAGDRPDSFGDPRLRDNDD